MAAAGVPEEYTAAGQILLPSILECSEIVSFPMSPMEAKLHLHYLQIPPGEHSAHLAGGQ